jgi:hypothetical protein
MRYTYLGDRITDPALINRQCEPVRDERGLCIVGRRMATALVIFEGEQAPRVVARRRLRVNPTDQEPT